MLAKLNEVQPSKIWISIPEIIDWNRPDKFKLKSSEEYDDIDISILKSEIGGEFTIPRLKTDRLSLIDEKVGLYINVFMRISILGMSNIF